MSQKRWLEGEGGVRAEENQEHMVSRKPREENVLKVDKSIEYYGNSNHEKYVIQWHRARLVPFQWSSRAKIFSTMD